MPLVSKTMFLPAKSKFFVTRIVSLLSKATVLSPTVLLAFNVYTPFTASSEMVLAEVPLPVVSSKFPLVPLSEMSQLVNLCRSKVKSFKVFTSSLLEVV